MIPPDFSKNFRKILKEKVLLKNKDGKTWYVEVKETAHGVFFKDGWQNFVDYHGLKIGEFLVFVYDGSYSFVVQIFGINGCKKEILASKNIVTNVKSEEEEEEETKKEMKPKHVTHLSSYEESEDNVPIVHIWKKLKKRARIRQGKQRVATPSSEEEESSDADSEIEAGKGVSTNFYTHAIKEKWKKFKRLRCFSERKIDEVSFSQYNIVDLLKNRNLMKTVYAIEPYAESGVRYFYTNLLKSFGNPCSNNCGKVYVRGKVFTVSTGLINEYLGTKDVETEACVENLNEVAHVITGGRTKKWSTPFRASTLSHLYSVVHKIMTSNWIATSNTDVVTKSHGLLLYRIGLGLPFNLGKAIFDQIASLAWRNHQGILPFPSLIYKLLKAQGLEDRELDVLSGDTPVCAINPTFFTGNKIIDLPWIDPNTATRCST